VRKTGVGVPVHQTRGQNDRSHHETRLDAEQPVTRCGLQRKKESGAVCAVRSSSDALTSAAAQRDVESRRNQRRSVDSHHSREHRIPPCSTVSRLKLRTERTK